MMNWINKKRNKKGFTLVELVVVIAILGILAAIAVPRLSGSRNTAKVATHNANVRMLKSTAMMVIADNPTLEGVTGGDVTTSVMALIDGKAPKPVIGDDEFKVVIDKTSGDIEVTPGEVEISTDEKTKGQIVLSHTKVQTGN